MSPRNYPYAIPIVLAVERFRLTHDGRVPASLQDLVPGQLPVVPTDPFDLQPLRYRPRQRGYLLYSIESDLVDNLGTEQPLGGTNRLGTDLIFLQER